MSEDAHLRFVEPDDPLAREAVELRYRVLREPLGLPESAVRFAFEPESLHLVALRDDRVIGCVLFHPTGEAGRLYQMAVDPAHQGTGLGRRLVEMLEAELRHRGVARVELHARDRAVGFYTRLGYHPEGPPVIEIGIPHQHMAKAL